MPINFFFFSLVLCLIVVHILVFRSKKSEMDWVIKRAGSSQVTGQSDAVVRMRGLPFGCSKEEIAQFFTGKLTCCIKKRK